MSAVLFLCSCGKEQGRQEEQWQRSLEEWREARVERLLSDQGWVNLAGLYWMEPGINTIGSDPSSRHVFPAGAPGKIGHFLLEDQQITFVPQPGIAVMLVSTVEADQENAAPDVLSEPMTIRTDAEGQPTLLQTGSFAWFVIKRGDRFGIRLRNYDHPALTAFEGIEYYPADPKWRIIAQYESLDTPAVILMGNVIGTIDTMIIKGRLQFQADGRSFHLYPFPAGERLFIVFADQTSGNETYGAGRFLYADRPDPDGSTVIDFNQAYNPPCAFTDYATCPLPPIENRLALRIEAGEKFTGH